MWSSGSNIHTVDVMEDSRPDLLPVPPSLLKAVLSLRVSYVKDSLWHYHTVWAAAWDVISYYLQRLIRITEVTLKQNAWGCFFGCLLLPLTSFVSKPALMFCVLMSSFLFLISSSLKTINPSTCRITCVWYLNHAVCFSHCFFSWSSLKVVFFLSSKHFWHFDSRFHPKFPKTSSAQTSLLIVLLVGPQREFNPIYTPRRLSGPARPHCTIFH